MNKSNGKRRPGRPRKNDGRRKFTTSLKPETVDLLREVGWGNANDGIERLARAFRDALKQGEK